MKGKDALGLSLKFADLRNFTQFKIGDFHIPLCKCTIVFRSMHLLMGT